MKITMTQTQLGVYLTGQDPADERNYDMPMLYSLGQRSEELALPEPPSRRSWRTRRCGCALSPVRTAFPALNRGRISGCR